MNEKEMRTQPGKKQADREILPVGQDSAQRQEDTQTKTIQKDNIQEGIQKETIQKKEIQKENLRKGNASRKGREKKGLQKKSIHKNEPGKENSEKQEFRKGNTLHNRDISSKMVFDNPVLCAQFLRDNIRIAALKNVQPEDIEDVSERYRPYLGTEFDSDSVKKIRILGIGNMKKTNKETKKKGAAGRQVLREPEFLISLIEHKSLVDYDVSMQLLRYMMCIWMEYRKEMERRQAGCTRRKGFRYPMIIPIVYYEGKDAWSAGRYLRDRIRESPGLGEWIPDFRYEVVGIHDYSDQELLDRGDEMSLIMLMNKIQNTEDLEQFIRIPADKVNGILQNSTEQVVDVLVSVMESLCFKIDVSEEERTQCVRKVRARNMGYLFENMEKISIQGMRRELRKEIRREIRREAAEEIRKAREEAKEELEKERIRADEAEEKLRAAEEIIRLLKQKDQ